MRLDITKLLYKPQYFQEQPIRLLHFIMQEWHGQFSPLNKDTVTKMRTIYTDCKCKSDKFVWQKTSVENQKVEVIACDDCRNWSLIMSQAQ